MTGGPLIAGDPETELLHWGRNEEFEEPTALFEIDTGTHYWVSAESAPAAVAILDGEGIDAFEGSDEEGVKTTITSLTLARANELRFFGEGDGDTSMAAEYNRDPSPRLIACEEW